MAFNAAKNPYGLRDGVLLHVDDVERGLACGCICPACGARLIAKQGEIVQHHFSHASGEDCGRGYETAVHMIAKDVLGTDRRLLLPPLKIKPYRSLLDRYPNLASFAETVVGDNCRVRLERVEIETSIGEIVPDVTVWAAGRPLIVEIFVTHAVTKEKAQKILELDIPAVEFDLSTLDRAATRDDIRKALVIGHELPGRGRGRWIYHRRGLESHQRLREAQVAAVRADAAYLEELTGKPGDAVPTQLSLFDE